MAHFSLFFLSLVASLTFLSFAIASIDEESSNVINEDPLIRQVVSGKDEDPLLNAEHHFSLFKAKFGKSYASMEEHDYRLSVFKANLRRAKRNQILDPSAVHGVTKFSDLTPSEFRRTYLGLHKQKRRLWLPADANKAPVLPTKDLPTDYDWRDHGAVTGVKDQVLI